MQLLVVVVVLLCVVLLLLLVVLAVRMNGGGRGRRQSVQPDVLDVVVDRRFDVCHGGGDVGSSRRRG